MPSAGLGYGSNTPTSVAGKLFSSLFFGIFLAAGLGFLGLILREEWAALRTWTWQKTPCEILGSQVSHTDPQGRRASGFYFEVRYRYQFGPRAFTSDRYTRQAASFSDYRKAERLTEEYPSESKASCYVNPSSPTEAVLVRDNFYLLPFALLPLVFIAIGGGALYYTWRPKAVPGADARPISERANLLKGQRSIMGFCAVFLLVGSVLLCVFFLWPICRIVQARSWPAVPCVVISSEVETHHGSKGSTYNVNIFYRYEVNGREFKSNRYQFLGGSSSGYSRKAAIVRQHPPGRHTVCYVNPADPTEAVLERGFTPDLWFGLIPLVFIAFGAIGIAATLRSTGQSGLAPGTTRSLSSGASARGLGSVLPAARGCDSAVLKPKAPPWVKLVGLSAMALFWNGIISFFVAQEVHGWRSGHGEWVGTLFMVPFVAVGLAFIGAIVYQLLALFNPRPRLRVVPGAVPLGGELRVEWELTGRTSVLKNLELRLQGREEVQYRQGKNTRTETNIFADIELATLTHPYEMRSGTCTVTVPGNLMHSFAGRNNRIIWSVRVAGEIPRWPDLKEEFPVAVLPAVRRAKEIA